MVEVRRGGVVEAVHRVHVATTDGESYGDPELVCFLRSASKPIQAIPFLEGYDDLDDDELAIACASHRAEPAQLAAARKVLARAGVEIDDLENGPQEGRPDGKLGNNCSGKHAGMLAACRGARVAAASLLRSGASAAAADRRADRPVQRDRRRRLRRADVRHHPEPGRRPAHTHAAADSRRDAGQARAGRRVERARSTPT